jgi:hypothetical protein
VAPRRWNALQGELRLLEAQDQERHSTYGKLSTLLNQQKQKNKEFTWDDDIPNMEK